MLPARPKYVNFGTVMSRLASQIGKIPVKTVANAKNGHRLIRSSIDLGGSDVKLPSYI